MDLEKAYEELSNCVIGYKNSPPKLNKAATMKVLRELLKSFQPAASPKVSSMMKGKDDGTRIC